MFDLFLLVTAAVIVGAACYGYIRTGDALMPMIVFAPMLTYTYVYAPAMLQYHGELERFFPDPDVLKYVSLLNLVGVGFFCLGCTRGLVPALVRSKWGAPLERFVLNRHTRVRLFCLSVVFGCMAAGSFAYLVASAGGLAQVFSEAKAYVPSQSGYLSEMRMLAYPAILLLAISVRGRRIRMWHVPLALLYASPHLIMASLGGRRGPAFLIVCTLVVSWYVARNRRPSLRSVVGTIGLLGVLMLFLVSNRGNFYLGSDFNIDSEAFVEALGVQEGSGGQEYIYASGLITTAEHFDQFYWGLRYFSLLFVRPIPKQLWPTKYEDIGLSWMVHEPGSGGFSSWDWLDAVGFLPLAGSAGGFVADMFVEFWWFGVLLCYGLGRLYVYCWRKSVAFGQLWTVIYMELLALSVYLPAQSVGAWLHRALLLVVPTWIAWTYFVQPKQQRRATSRPPQWRPVSG